MLITVFTPSYNRAHLLPRLYESLLQQSSHNFEWLIVDDGSEDQTQSVVEAMQKEQKIPIRFLKKENGGKHTAHNAALQIAAGEWFLCVDSDDSMPKDAIRQLEALILRAQKQDCAILGCKAALDGSVLCKPVEDTLPHLSFYSHPILRCGGEYAMAFRTDVLRQYPFPVIPSERFMTEEVLLDALELAGYTVMPSSIVLILCEYQPDGLTANISRIMKRNPAGYCLYFMQRIDLQPSWKSRFLIAGKYRCFCLFAGKKKTPYRGKHPVCAALAAPLGLLFWVYYKLLRGF